MTRHLKKGLEVRRKSSRWVLVKPKLMSTLRRSIRNKSIAIACTSEKEAKQPRKDGFLFCKTQ